MDDVHLTCLVVNILHSLRDQVEERCEFQTTNTHSLVSVRAHGRRASGRRSAPGSCPLWGWSFYPMLEQSNKGSGRTRSLQVLIGPKMNMRTRHKRANLGHAKMHESLDTPPKVSMCKSAAFHLMHCDLLDSALRDPSSHFPISLTSLPR